MSTFNYSVRNRYVRSKSGLLGGVCDGLARSYGISTLTVRVCFVLSTFLFGASVGIYLLLWLVLPREDQVFEYYREKLLGVCHEISMRTNTELAVIRVLALVLAMLSFGSVLLAYFALFIYFEFSKSKVLK